MSCCKSWAWSSDLMALPSTPFYEENAQGEGFKAATLSDDVFFQFSSCSGHPIHCCWVWSVSSQNLVVQLGLLSQIILMLSASVPHTSWVRVGHGNGWRLMILILKQAKSSSCRSFISEFHLKDFKESVVWQVGAGHIKNHNHLTPVLYFGLLYTASGFLDAWKFLVSFGWRS